MLRLPLALFAVVAWATCGPLCAQQWTAVDKQSQANRLLEPEPNGETAGDGSCQSCDSNCDANSSNDRCFDGHRLGIALTGLGSLLPPAPPSTSSPSDSWNRYPLSAGWFLGGAEGSNIIDDWVSMSGGVVGGLRLGWDVNSNVGLEARMAFGSLAVNDSFRAQLAEAAANATLGTTAPTAQNGSSREGDIFQFDADVLLYPWGDTRWRPYVLFGLGTTSLRFTDALSQSYSTTGISLPFGIGLKYLWNDRLAVRFDLVDDVVFRDRSDFNTVNVLSFTGGIELRFGGSRQVYWPYDPGYQGW
jgi:hypothetical protein